MDSVNKVFLSASWEYLALINYEVDPAVLTPHLPPFTQLDLFEGRALVSVVGFLFNNTRVLGIKWPYHTNFEEVNLRYYVRHFDGSNWKRGVGFISEIVPKPIIAKTANLLYNEHYTSAKMAHEISFAEKEIIAKYKWKVRHGGWNSIEVKGSNIPEDFKSNSEEEFIMEHYFGYNKLNNHTTIEYTVSHPRWKVFPVIDHALDCNFKQFYGKEFQPFIENIKPHSVFLAKGSDVNVGFPIRINRGYE